MKKQDIADIRHDYGKFKFDEHSVNKNPFEQFDIWFKDTLAGNFVDPNAFVLSTVSAESKPSSRVLLIKGYDERGFVFYSNYESHKGRDLKANSAAAMLFFWDKYERQVRIEGRIEKTSEEESLAYFQTRPYTSRLGAWASEQSEVLKSRFSLIRKVARLMLKYPFNVPLPPYWGGYRMVPEYFEFWQGRESRLHDRFAFRLKDDKSWEITRLNP